MMMRMQATAERLASSNRISRECEGKTVSWSDTGDLAVAKNGVDSHYIGQVPGPRGTYVGDGLKFGKSSSTDIAKALLAEMGVRRPREIAALLPDAEALFAGLVNLEGHTLHLSHGAEMVAQRLGLNTGINLA